jgi:hypothetical protein
MNTNQKILGRLRLLAAKCEGLKEFGVKPSSLKIADVLRLWQRDSFTPVKNGKKWAMMHSQTGTVITRGHRSKWRAIQDHAAAERTSELSNIARGAERRAAQAKMDAAYASGDQRIMHETRNSLPSWLRNSV